MVDEPQLTPDAQKAMLQIQKLLNLAAKNSSQEEAASAAAKAQELMTKYNLDAALVERAGGVADGRREDLKTRGGFYQYQRDLWNAVAQLNFCLYWTQIYTDQVPMPNSDDGTGKRRMRTRFQKRHRIVGRIINTTGTRTMADYLEQTVERFVRDEIGGDRTQLYSRYAMSYREGMVDRLCEKIGARFRARLAEEQRRDLQAAKERRDAAATTSVSGKELTLSNYVKSEKDANMDFLHGEGYTARKAAQEAEWRAEAARDRAEEEAAYTAWAAANPEEARRRIEEEEKRQARNDKRRTGRRYSYAQEKPQDHNAYHAGRKAAEKVSLEPQVDRGRAARIGSR